MKYSFIEACVAIVWMAWVLVIGIIEALIHILFPSIFIIIGEDKWSVRFLRYKRQ